MRRPSRPTVSRCLNGSTLRSSAAAIAALRRALELARAGVRVAVLDAGPLGGGASSRNGGMVGGAVKLDWQDLARRVGPGRAAALLDGARASFEFLESLIAREGLDAAYERCGRFLLACHPAQFGDFERQVQALGAGAEGVRLVPRARQREEIGSDAYHGGVLIEPAGALHPARFHRGLAAAARAAGAALHGYAEVGGLERKASGFVLTTARGRLQAAEVVVATNGYTGPLTPALQRRVIPVSSYIIATEELPPELTRRLSPNGRTFVDGRRLLSYFRLSPDGRRVLFGGRVSLADVDEQQSAQGLHRRLIRVWPELAGRRITHSWKGTLAFTFDRLPHMGVLADRPCARRAFRHGLQRQRGRHGDLARPPDRAQAARSGRAPLPVRRPGFPDAPAVLRQALVPACGRRLVPAARCARHLARPLTEAAVWRRRAPVRSRAPALQ